MSKKYLVTLTETERLSLEKTISTGKASARLLQRARILLKTDAGPHGPRWSDEKVCDAFEVNRATVYRVRQRFVEEGLEAALRDRQRQRHRAKVLDGRGEAQLIALACSETPSGVGHWTLRLLADKMVELEHVESISHETVRQVLKKAKLSLGSNNPGVFHRKPTPTLSAKWKTSSMSMSGRTIQRSR